MFFVVGLVVGSFLNVVVRRGARAESLGGRSRCESCSKVLGAGELLPVISFLLQKGRCRHCGAALSWQYPAVELGTGFTFAALAWYLLPDVLNPKALILFGAVLIGTAAVIVILVSDINYRLIPDGAVLILFLLGMWRLWITSPNLLRDGVWALLIALFFAALWFASSGSWMGLGDAKLILGTSLLLGFPASPIAFLFSFWLGGIVGIFLLATRLTAFKDKIPFGPFIILGALLSYLFSQQFLFITGLDYFL